MWWGHRSVGISGVGGVPVVYRQRSASPMYVRSLRSNHAVGRTLLLTAALAVGFLFFRPTEGKAQQEAASLEQVVDAEDVLSGYSEGSSLDLPFDGLGSSPTGSTARIHQLGGEGNRAAVRQRGDGHVALVAERGSRNAATILQDGHRNRLSLKLLGSDQAFASTQRGQRNDLVWKIDGRELSDLTRYRVIQNGSGNTGVHVIGD